MIEQPFQIAQGDLIRVRVTAKNSLGFGVPSLLNTQGAKAFNRPHKPPLAPLREVSTSTSQLVVTYANLDGELTGGSQVTSLHLQWDEGTVGRSWQTLIGEYPNALNQVFTISGLVQTGHTYQFRYRARNLLGWGEWSDSAYVLAASLPETSMPIISTLENTNLRLSWSANTIDNGSAITEYSIKIKDAQNNFFENELCDGASLEVLN